MAFAQPLFLIALAALSIPIIIHLFNFRKYKKVFFTNVKFIADIKQESRKRSRLKHLLILLARLLAITCLVLAFAQPYIPSPFQNKKLTSAQAISVYIDNSFSMEALSSQGRLLDVAKAKALEIADAFKTSDRFQLLTNDFEGRHQRFVSQDEFRVLVEEVKTSPSVKALQAVIKRQEDILAPGSLSNRSVFMISDFQKSTSFTQELKADTSLYCFFVPVNAEKQNNLYIDTIWFDSPVQQANQPVKMKVRIKNKSGETMEKIPVKLLINKSQKAIASVSINPQGETDVILPYTNNDAGIQYGRLEITDYPVTWDDAFYFAYHIVPSIPVLCINTNNESPYLNALFVTDSSFHFKNASLRQLDYSSFDRYSLIILNGIDEYSSGLIQELTRFVRNGGNILIFPAAKVNVSDYRDLFSSLGQVELNAVDTISQRISELNPESPIFSDVFEKNQAGKIVLPENIDLPMVFRHYIMKRDANSGWEDLLSLQNGQPFLSTARVDKGKVYLCAVPLEETWSTFPKHPVFVPTLYKIAVMSEPFLPLYYSLVKEDPVVLEKDSLSRKEVYRIRKLDSDFEFIPETRTMGSQVILLPHEQIREAGHYIIAEGNRVMQGLAFNYDRKESDLACYTADELRKILDRAHLKYYALLTKKKEPLTKQIHEMTQGIPLWKLFILLTLLFIALEIFFIRLLKE
jgi:hypothetical protein